jgi:hypothetical protein
MGKWLALVRKHASCLDSAPIRNGQGYLRYTPTTARGTGGPRGIRTPVSALRGTTHLHLKLIN